MKAKDLPAAPRSTRTLFADFPASVALAFGVMLLILFFVFQSAIFPRPDGLAFLTPWTLTSAPFLLLALWGLRRAIALRRLARNGVAVQGTVRERGSRNEGLFFKIRVAFSWQGANHERWVLCTETPASEKIPRRGHVTMLVDPRSGLAFPLLAVLHFLDDDRAREASEERVDLETLQFQALLMPLLGVGSIALGILTFRDGSYVAARYGISTTVSGWGAYLFATFLVVFGVLAVVAPFIVAKRRRDRRLRLADGIPTGPKPPAGSPDH